MPDVGSDFISSPVNLPINYAAQDWNIEQNQAHKFDQYTNPFLLAQSFNQTELPLRQQADQEAQAQAQNILANKQYQLQQTQQASMLPLQMQGMSAQTAQTQAMTAAQAFALHQQQTGAAQVPSLAATLANVAPGDNAGLYGAAAANPAALATPQGQAIYSRAQQFGDTQLGIQQQALAGADSQKGAAQALSAPVGIDPTQYWNSNHPQPQQSDFTNPADFQKATISYNNQMQGFYQNFARQQMLKSQGAIRTATAEIQSGGRIGAASVRALAPLFQNGTLNYTALAAQIGPMAASEISSQMGAPGQQDENGGPLTQPGQPVVSPEVAKQNLTNASKILSNLNATSEEKTWAQDALNNNGRPNYQMPEYDPAGSQEIQILQADVKNRMAALANASHDTGVFGSMLGSASPYDTQMTALKDAQSQLQQAQQKYRLNPGTTPVSAGLTPYGATNVNTTMPQSPAANGAASAASAPAQAGFSTGFGNDFMGQPDYSPVMAPNRGAPAATPATGAAPATQATPAPAATARTTQTQPANQTVSLDQLTQGAKSIGINDVRYMVQGDKQALAYALLHPNDPGTPKILEKIKTTYRGM